MKFSFFVLALMAFLYASASFANLDLITWKGTYYQAIPNKKGISKKYCQDHTPGSFIHVVKDALAHPVYTDKGIKLDRATFNMDMVHGVYLIYGDFWATGKTSNKIWQDHIYYYLSKLTEDGIGRGVWSSEECKGFYVGVAIKNKNLIRE